VTVWVRLKAVTLKLAAVVIPAVRWMRRCDRVVIRAMVSTRRRRRAVVIWLLLVTAPLFPMSSVTVMMTLFPVLVVPAEAGEATAHRQVTVVLATLHEPLPVALPPLPPLVSVRDGRRLTVSLLPGDPHALLLEEEIASFRPDALHRRVYHRGAGDPEHHRRPK